MIGSLRGRLIDKQPPTVVIECHGVGYEVETPMSTFLELPATGKDVFLETHLLVREDAQVLYGFATPAEKALFRLLIKVTGVGAKMALAVLSSMNVADFERSIEYEDTTMLVKVPGIGKKTAERLIIEMRDKISKAPKLVTTSPEQRVSSAKTEAVDALIALGYKPREVNKLIESLDVDKLSAEDIIRSALRQAAS